MCGHCLINHLANFAAVLFYNIMRAYLAVIFLKISNRPFVITNRRMNNHKAYIVITS